MSVFTGRFGRWAKALLGGALVVSAVAVVQSPSSPLSATTADQRDAAFSTNATAAMPPNALLRAMVEMPNGKWMVATEAGLVRLNADGSKDSTYAGNYDTPTTGVARDIPAMDVDANGGVIYSHYGDGKLARLNPDGSTDAGFAFDEVGQSPFLVNSPFNFPPTAIKVLASGDILVAGDFNASNAYGTSGLVKITAAGDPVAVFNNNVGSSWYGTGTSPAARELEVDSQGRILLAGLTYNSVPMLVRFSANGTPDTTFNTTLGNWIGTAPNSEGYDVELLADGGYLLVGVSGAPQITLSVDATHPLAPLPSSPYPTCLPVTLFRIEADGSSNTSINGTEDTSSNATCASNSQRTIVGGSLHASLRAGGDFYGDEYGGVSVDPNGDILVAGRFFDADADPFESGLARFSSSGQFVSLAERGTANWAGWGTSTSRPIRLVAKSAAGDNIVALSAFSYNGSAWVTDVKIRKYSAAPVPPPTVSAVSPTSGSTAGGTAITITGTNLGNASTVTVGSAACTNVVVVSATSITCTTPAGSAGTASVVVTSGGQSNATNTLFTYNAPSTTTTAPVTTAPVTTTPASTTPATTTAPSGPVNVTSSNQATLTRTPGAATALVNGQPVTVDVETPADLPAARVDPEDRSPAQVQALQAAADDLVSQLNQSAGGDSGLAVQDTPTGAAITGLLDKPVAVENTVLVEAGNKSTLFAALNQDGSVTEVQPGAVIEVLGNGQVGVVASGLTPGEAVEFVIMSTPTLLGSYTVASNGTIKAQASLPAGVGLGDHTLVVASPTVQASLGLKVSATPATLPATGVSNGSNTLQIALWLIVGGLMVAYLRRRRLILN